MQKKKAFEHEIRFEHKFKIDNIILGLKCAVFSFFNNRRKASIVVFLQSVKG